MSKPTPLIFTCPKCNKSHQGLPAISFDAPLPYADIPDDEREARTLKSDDLCIVDGEDFFIRAVLKIPIIGEREHLEWGVWGSLSEENFAIYEDTFDEVTQGSLKPMCSWFSNNLPHYPQTCGMQAQVIPQDGGQRPFIEFHPSDEHPLALDFKNGITLDRAIQFVLPVLHAH